MDNLENILANMVRIGTVSATDTEKRSARVIYKDRDNLVSGWLYVLQHSGADVRIEPDGVHTHTITDTYSGGGSASDEGEHDHSPSSVKHWMPKVNDTVVVLYLPVFNGDGFILGAI